MSFKSGLEVVRNIKVSFKSGLEVVKKNSSKENNFIDKFGENHRLHAKIE